jgi:hypothetical protein
MITLRGCEDLLPERALTIEQVLFAFSIALA